jgi:hypothetical protein
MIARVTATAASTGEATGPGSAAAPNFAPLGDVVDESRGLNLVNRYQI